MAVDPLIELQDVNKYAGNWGHPPGRSGTGGAWPTPVTTWRPPSRPGFPTT